MLKEIIKRVLYSNGLFRSPAKLTQTMDEEIFLTMKSIGQTFKEDSLSKEIEQERLKISLELEAFVKGYENGEIEDAIANVTIDKLTQKYKDLEIKIDDLSSIRTSIKSLDSKNKEKQKEFDEEIKKHKGRSVYELEKGL